MIVVYDAKGEITHYVQDPVPAGLKAIHDANGDTYLDFPPVSYEVEEMLPDTDEDGVTTPKPTMITHTDHVDGRPDTYYVVGTNLVLRPVLDLPAEHTMGVGDEVVISLPDPAYVAIDGVQHTITGGELELVGETPTEYYVHFEFPNKFHTLKVIVE